MRRSGGRAGRRIALRAARLEGRYPYFRKAVAEAGRARKRGRTQAPWWRQGLAGCRPFSGADWPCLVPARGLLLTKADRPACNSPSSSGRPAWRACVHPSCSRVSSRAPRLRQRSRPVRMPVPSRTGRRSNVGSRDQNTGLRLTESNRMAGCTLHRSAALICGCMSGVTIAGRAGSRVFPRRPWS